ncbi:MAG TPA: 3-phosphoshikimate 1-carboxyvinyltransferase, partial [Polyangiaceae bacterium]|nr:3-phosphoshikimate 1-carboxyvinyltransferase [Polyangiaceae bacterium]
MSFPAGPLAITPLRSPSEAQPFVWHVPGSKSITNRAFVLAALAEGETVLRGVLHSDDTRHMRNALTELGIEFIDMDATTVRVRGGRSRLRTPSKELFIGNSGTTVRFLAGLAALVPGPVTLVGDEHMAKRPIQDLIDGLAQLGVRVDCATGCPPLTVHGGSLPGGVVSMRGNKSSQYFTALLMAAPLATSELTLEVEGELVSRPYIGITLSMMRAFGVAVEESEKRFVIPGGQSY